jgi:hypothetical protein
LFVLPGPLVSVTELAVVPESFWTTLTLPNSMVWDDASKGMQTSDAMKRGGFIRLLIGTDFLSSQATIPTVSKLEE